MNDDHSYDDADDTKRRQANTHARTLESLYRVRGFTSFSKWINEMVMNPDNACVCVPYTNAHELVSERVASAPDERSAHHILVLYYVYGTTAHVQYNTEYSHSSSLSHWMYIHSKRAHHSTMCGGRTCALRHARARVMCELWRRVEPQYTHTTHTCDFC